MVTSCKNAKLKHIMPTAMTYRGSALTGNKICLQYIQACRRDKQGPYLKFNNSSSTSEHPSCTCQVLKLSAGKKLRQHSNCNHTSKRNRCTEQYCKYKPSTDYGIKTYSLFTAKVVASMENSVKNFFSRIHFFGTKSWHWSNFQARTKAGNF